MTYARSATGTMNDFLEYYSSWYRLQKGVAWLMRFLLFLNQRIHGEREFTSGPLTVTEIRVATKWIVRHLQQQHFPDVMKALRGNLASLKRVAVKRSQLNKLNPILVDGILRMGGRFERATISFNAKHPMILPPHHHVTDLIIQHYHRQEGHMGPTQVLATIRQMFWILHGPTEVRRVINNCVCIHSNIAECNKIVSSASIENSDHKTDSVVNKKEKSSFLFYSENNFTWKGDLKSLKAFVATILICDDAKWSSPRAVEKLFKTAEFTLK